MHYLIDGHNLIAQIEDIRLSDPDDEAQLILRLRRWISASPKRKVTVYFDGGLPGGEARNMSGPRLRVLFASSNSNADALLIKRIRQVKNPPEYMLVTNDREIIEVGARRRMPHLPADEFAGQIAAEAEARAQPEAPSRPEEPALSAAEVAEWLEMFGPEPELPTRAPRRRRRRKKGSAPEEKPSGKPPQPVRPADELKQTGAGLTEAEVAAWLEEFGDQPRPAAPDKDAADEKTLSSAERARLRKELRRRRQERRTSPRPADQMKSSGAKLSRDEVDTWLDIFANPEDDDG